MSYCLHIERQEDPVTLKEWKETINEINGARIQKNDIIGINPSTREKITISFQEGDVEILYKVNFIQKIFGKKSFWEPGISFYQGVATFTATEDVENKNNPIHKVVVMASKKLNAIIRGDEGEIYKW